MATDETADERADDLLAELAADHATDVARARRETAAALEEHRRRLRDLPGTPIPGTRAGIAASGVPGEDESAASGIALALAELRDRLDRLDRDERSADAVRCERAALAWFNRLADGRQLLAELVPDPSLPRPFAGDPRTALRVATSLIRFRRRQPLGRITRLADLARVSGVDRAFLRHLLHTGCELAGEPVEPVEPPEPVEPTGPPPGGIGVLLPVRLETRYIANELRVRVVPDEPWFDRHDPTVSEGELDSLGAYLAAVAEAPGDDAVRRLAWEALASQVEPARAAYLIRSWVVMNNGVPEVRPPAEAEKRTGPTFPRIAGFPRRLTVWLQPPGLLPAPALILEVKRERLLADFADPDSGESRWWEDWQEAVDIGMAGSIPLTDHKEFDAVFITGIDEDEPASLFAAHRDAGRLALLAPGTPTNSVDGSAAAPLGDDPQLWWETVQSPAGEADRDVSRALTADPDLLGNLPGPSSPQGAENRAMVTGLWPALWGFAGADVWATPAQTADAAELAALGLHPEGPFPTLRIGSQPYGLLPATDLEQWKAAEGDPVAETALGPGLRHLADVWRAASEARGTVHGTSTATLLDLIGQVPTSPLYRHRRAWPQEFWWLLLLLLGFGVPWDEIEQRWRDAYPLPGDLGLDPLRRYGSIAAARRLELPLIWPAELPPDRSVGEVIEQIAMLAEEAPSLFSTTQLLELEILQFPPESLLLRLVIRSLQVAVGDVGRVKLGEDPPQLEQLLRSDAVPGRLQTWIDSTNSGDLQGAGAEARAFRRTRDALLELAQLPALHDPERSDGRAERLLRATLDCATHRVDPWLIAPATRRLRALAAKPLAPPRLGAYGWVDDLRPGTPGPTPAGLLHAPSPAQATVAAVLRDRDVNDAQDGRWDLDLTSRSVRDADRLAEHVRVGAHLAEALGREVERVIGTRADIDRLRRDFPVRTEHEGRRVCDGLAVLDASPAALGLDPNRLAELARLRAAVDAYGDLLVAEAVHHVAEGRAEVAGAVMDAAAGFARPPHLSLLRTAREGRAVQSTAVVVLGDVAEPALPPGLLDRATVSPLALADAAVTSFVAAQTGGAALWSFDVAPVDDDGLPSGPGMTVRLADLGLLPAAALTLARTDLERLAERTAAEALGLDPGTVTVVGGDAAERYEAAARLVTTLGRLPAGPDAVAPDIDALVDQTGVDADLRQRLGMVLDTAEAMVNALTGELGRTSGDGTIGTADADALRRLVVAARSWGIAPDPAADVVPEGATPAEASERLLVSSAARVLELMTVRVASAPPDVTILARDELVDAVVALVAPTGQLAMTSRLNRSVLPALARAGAEVTDDWLPTVGAVRTALGRVEVQRLLAGSGAGSGPALVPWSNKPSDPWQKDDTNPHRLVVGFADATLDLDAVPVDARVAVAMLDRLTEVVPQPEQTTGVAFGFDAPGARAPQAILLAVPPSLDKPLDDAQIVRIVAHTRAHARARVARPGDLGPGLRGPLPTVLLPASGPTQVPLDPAKE